MVSRTLAMAAFGTVIANIGLTMMALFIPNLLGSFEFTQSYGTISLYSILYSIFGVAYGLCMAVGFWTLVKENPLNNLPKRVNAFGYLLLLYGVNSLLSPVIFDVSITTLSVINAISSGIALILIIIILSIHHPNGQLRMMKWLILLQLLVGILYIQIVNRIIFSHPPSESSILFSSIISLIINILFELAMSYLLITANTMLKMEVPFYDSQYPTPGNSDLILN